MKCPTDNVKVLKEKKRRYLLDCILDHNGKKCAKLQKQKYATEASKFDEVTPTKSVTLNRLSALINSTYYNECQMFSQLPC